jgi:hypothetical protein
MWQALISPIANIAGTYLEGKQKKAQAKAKLEVAKVEATVRKVKQDGEWESAAMSASSESWKDEAWTICFIAIIFACFIPALQPYIADGFRFLREDCPEWLSWGILVSIGASFGVKSIGAFKK